MEFLSLCDLLFNIISFTLYFCNVLFDIVLTWALFERSKFCFYLSFSIIASSLVVCQILSLLWYYKSKINSESATKKEKPETQNSRKYNWYIVIAFHIGLSGVFWRYAKLFIPVNLETVKTEVRDLCILRLMHGFLQSIPNFLVQASIYLSIYQQNNAQDGFIALSEKPANKNIQSSRHHEKAFKDLCMVAATLSMCSVCWALASFSKHVRKRNIHRFVLTWLGVIFQFCWRFGTITSRLVAMIAYTVAYGYWIVLFVVLHWISMIVWLFCLNKGELRTTYGKSVGHLMLSFVYIFAYINLKDCNHTQNMIIYYIVTLLENCLLVSFWSYSLQEKLQYWFCVPLTVIGSFILGVWFMFLYYRFFHVCRLKNESLESELTSENLHGLARPKEPEIKTSSGGVFNCRFSNPVQTTASRKKKKPSTFVPPPANDINTSTIRQANIPFWKKAVIRPPNESSSSNFNLHNRFQQNDSQTSLNDAISQDNIQSKTAHSSEVKKLRNNYTTDGSFIPNKSLKVLQDTFYEKDGGKYFFEEVNEQQKPNKTREFVQGQACEARDMLKNALRIKTQTPEILLTPHYQNSCIYYNFISKKKKYFFPKDLSTKQGENVEETKIDSKEIFFSDKDSEVSLPRSFTLPREFKYNRKLRRKLPCPVPMSNNSSDGDVDSCEDHEDPHTREKPVYASNVLDAKVHRYQNVPLSGLDLLNGHMPTRKTQRLVDKNNLNKKNRSYFDCETQL